MACPGDANRRLAQGSNRLLAEGAFLVQNVEDVLAALAQELRRERAELEPGDGDATPAPEEDSLEERGGLGGRDGQDGQDRPAGANPLPGYADDLVRLILQMLEEEPRPADLILDRCLESGHPGPAVLDRLLRLEMDGLVRQMPGRLYALARALG
jgi:predicted Rossmann fold nucleotide-binding protein DprA/Smf involved in DNA uptake